MQKTGTKTWNMVGLALMTAIVVVLQLVGATIRFGTFSVSLVLVPIVVGAALFGRLGGAWLGFVFGAVVLLSGDAAPFLTVNAAGTILTVLLKGTLAGLLAGVVYRLFQKWVFVFKNVETGKERWNINLGVVLAAVVCPVVNSGIFYIGCRLFFMDTIKEWAAAAGSENVALYIIVGLIGLNFVFELLVNVILSPVIVRIIDLGKKHRRKA